MTLRFRAAVRDRRPPVPRSRVDHSFTNNHRMYGRFWVSRASHASGARTTATSSAARFGRTWQNTVVSVNDTYLSRSEPAEQPGRDVQPNQQLNFQIYPPDYSTLGINVYNDDTPQWFFNVTGYFGINSGDTNTFLRNEVQFVDTVRWTKGRHEIASGIRLQLRRGGHRQQLPRERPVHVPRMPRRSAAMRSWTSISASSPASSRR